LQQNTIRVYAKGIKGDSGSTEEDLVRGRAVHLAKGWEKNRESKYQLVRTKVSKKAMPLDGGTRKVEKTFKRDWGGRRTREPLN